jgi:hypothetical protein
MRKDFLMSEYPPSRYEEQAGTVVSKPRKALRKIENNVAGHLCAVTLTFNRELEELHKVVQAVGCLL